MKNYKKVQMMAKNLPSGSYAAGCPVNTRSHEVNDDSYSSITNSSERIGEGDIVRHKLGGPEMVVFHIEDGEACCQWLNGETLKDDCFSIDKLEKMPEDQQIKSIREIKNGDFVQFKLGGPIMIVECIEDGDACCQRRLVDNSFESEVFALNSLKSIKK